MRRTKPVCFNIVTEAKELEFAESLDNYSGWVKDRIREHMDSSQLISPALERAIQELIKRQITIFEVPEGAKSDVEAFF